jgi:hypothetical protein
MNLKDYLYRIRYTKKSPFCKIEIDSIKSQDLNELCDLSIGKKRLYVAWSLIIDIINDKFQKEVNSILTPKIVEFLIENNICLSDLGHLKLKNEYLEKIYEKDRTCWEALKNINNELNDT